MPENISPEERLFNVIQDNKNAPAKKNLSAGQNKFDLKGAQDYLNKNLIALKINLQAIDLKAANKILAIVLVIFGAGVIYFTLKSKPNIAALGGAINKTSVIGFTGKVVEEFKPVGAYLEDVKKRDIFKPAPRTSGGFASAGGLKDLVKDLNLSGIFEGEYPEVIIEDKTAKKSYFLKEGQEIRGMKIKSILKDRVILQYGDEEIELI